MDDSEREKKPLYGVDPSTISDLFDSYQHRIFNEDILKVAELNGEEGLAVSLNTSLIKGRSEADTDRLHREEHFSNNKPEDEEEVSMFDLICQAFEDFMIQILVVAAVVQIVIGLSPLSQTDTDWIDGMAIVFAICVVVITSAATNYSKEKKFQELKKINQSMFEVTVMKYGVTSSISSSELLVGDLVKLEYGMIIPADGILVKGENITVNESSITGESHSVSKESHAVCMKLSRNFNRSDEKNNTSLPSSLLISGTCVNSGSGWFLVLAVGKHSVKGKIGEVVLNSKVSSTSPLEEKLNDIANDIGKFGLFSAIITFIALLAKLLFYKFQQYHYHLKGHDEHIRNEAARNATLSANSNYTSKSQFYSNPYEVFETLPKEILNILMLCVTIIVVAIPEGLPLAVTLALSFSVRKMMEDNNLVRHLNACETMGGANYILSDKTGTLTENKMTLVSIYDNTDVIDVSDPIHIASLKRSAYSTLLSESLSCNIDVEVDAEGNQTAGSKTDFSLYKFLLAITENNLSSISSKYKIIERIPFHSQRKRMSTIIERNGKYFAFVKGAKEFVLPACESYIDSSSNTKSLDQRQLELINKISSDFSSLTHRCIAVAFKEVKNISNIKEFIANNSNIADDGVTNEYLIEKSGFTFIGILAINDKLKPNVPESIKICNQSGIKVIMVTGDNQQTAEAFAKSCHIMNHGDNDCSMTGSEFYSIIEGVICRTCMKGIDYCLCITRKKAEEEDNDKAIVGVQDLGVGNMTTFSKIASTLKVLARARPIDKFALVLGLRELDNVVAVTGDGSNDAQALSKADVGFAMGIQGTEVAKNASDIIVLDDNFASIVSSIKWGRNIFDNIRKFIQFQLSVNLSAVLLVFVTSCIGSESPICPIQMLWLNLIMDSLGSLALATESPSDDLLKRKPYSRREYIINKLMWKHVIVQSLVQFTLIFLLYIYAEKIIIEESEQRIDAIKLLENCFGDFSAEIVKYQKNKMLYYIVDGKKSSWSAMQLIKPDLDPTYCPFYDRNIYPQQKVRNLEEAFRWYNSVYGNTTHMTIIFNCFVLYSLFNQINSRILDDSFNILKRLGSSLMFVVVFLIEFGVQVLIIEYGGLVFKCALGGLTSFQWGMCLAFASISFWVSIFIKFVPLEKMTSSVVASHHRGSIEMREELIKNEENQISI